jgi:hypothetical protein
MIRAGFLSEAERQALIGLARDGLAEHRIARRANAIVLLDKGWSCAKVASALLLDDDTVRGWYRAYESDGLNGISSFGHEGMRRNDLRHYQEILRSERIGWDIGGSFGCPICSI